MTITVTHHWAGTYRMLNENKRRGPIITEDHRKVAVRLLEEEGVCGKGQRYRYLSDRLFKTKAAAERFFSPLQKKHAILALVIDVQKIGMMHF